MRVWAKYENMRDFRTSLAFWPPAERAAFFWRHFSGGIFLAAYFWLLSSGGVLLFSTPNTRRSDGPKGGRTRLLPR